LLARLQRRTACIIVVVDRARSALRFYGATMSPRRGGSLLRQRNLRGGGSRQRRERDDEWAQAAVKRLRARGERLSRGATMSASKRESTTVQLHGGPAVSASFSKVGPRRGEV
jgi:hypothetical protein